MYIYDNRRQPTYVEKFWYGDEIGKARAKEYVNVLKYNQIDKRMHEDYVVSVRNLLDKIRGKVPYNIFLIYWDILNFDIDSVTHDLYSNKITNDDVVKVKYEIKNSINNDILDYLNVMYN